jgi:nuclear pore complex protein Nup155
MEGKMRIDEQDRDLFKRLQYRSDLPGNHRYFIEPYKSSFGSMVEHNGFLPFPKEIQQQYSKIECASFMGIIPEIHRVWMTVDNILYLWNYLKPDDVQVFDDVQEVIVSVALSVPKPGIFLETVKYLLILATPVEIVVLALCGSDERCEVVKVVPTTYRLPSDQV